MSAPDAASRRGAARLLFDPRVGTVSTFDEARGLGVVSGEDGMAHPFHCAALADGTRTVEVGARVRFRVIPGRLGRWEAWAIEKLPG